MLIAINSFSGIAPRVHPANLAPTQAQTALNAMLTDGALGPRLAGAQVTTIVGRPGVKKALYRFGHDAPSDVNYWFTSLTEASFCRSQIFGDTTERTYFTDGVKPKFTDATLALSNTPYPFSSYELGVPAPDSAMIATLGGTGSGVIETRAYVCTFVRSYSSWQEESMPSPVVTCDVLPGQTVTLSSLPTPPSGSHNITHRRFYRTSTGSQGTNYYYVGTHAVASTSFLDDVLAEGLGEVLPSMTWDVPPDGLEGMIALANGMNAAFLGKDIYFSEPYKPHAWPADYQQSVDYPVVGLAKFGTGMIALTKGVPYIFSGTHPGSMGMQPLDFSQACVSRRSISRFGNGVLYASPDGLAYVGTDGSRVVTEPLMTRKEWYALCDSTTLHGYEHDGRYYGFHSTGGFIFDPMAGANALTTHDVVAHAGYVDLQSDALYYVINDSVFRMHTGAATIYTWKSKVFVAPKLATPGFAQVIADDYTSLTFKLYADGALKQTKTVTSKLPFRLPAGYRGMKFEIELTGTSRVTGVFVADSIGEMTRV